MAFTYSKTFDFTDENPVGVTMTTLPVGAEWRADGPNAPEAAVENSDLVYQFSAGLNQNLTMYFKVPQGYTFGHQLLLYISYYTASTSGTVLFQATTTLVRQNVDPLSSPANSRASTNTAITNSVAVGNAARMCTIDLTSSTGTINATTILPGDLLLINLSRGTDTDSATVRMIPNSTEISFE